MHTSTDMIKQRTIVVESGKSDKMSIETADFTMMWFTMNFLWLCFLVVAQSFGPKASYGG